jgi:AcrR family transcriptional regulator
MSPRGQIQNEQMRAETLKKINKAALEVFAEFGYAGATMKQIAQAAGLSYGLVYHYFPSKEMIFCNLVDFALDSSFNTITSGLDFSGTAWDKIMNLSESLSKQAFSGESALLFIIMMQALTQGRRIPGLAAHIAERSREHYGSLIPVIAQAQRDGKVAEGDPIMLSAAYFSFVQGLALLAFGGQGMEKKIRPEMLYSVLKK